MKLFQNKKSLVSSALSIFLSVTMVAGIVEAASTISTNISTGGTLAVTGVSTLTGGITSGANITVPATYSLDVASAGVLNIGTTTATSITIGNTSAITSFGAGIRIPAAYGFDVSSAGQLNLGTTTASTVLIGNSTATTTIQGGLGVENATGSVSANAVTISKVAGVFTDTTDINASTTRPLITLTNTRIVSTSVILANVCSVPDTNAVLSVVAVPQSGKAAIYVSNSGFANQTTTFSVCFLVTN